MAAGSESPFFLSLAYFKSVFLECSLAASSLFVVDPFSKSVPFQGAASSVPVLHSQCLGLQVVPAAYPHRQARGVSPPPQPLQEERKHPGPLTALPFHLHLKE